MLDKTTLFFVIILISTSLFIGYGMMVLWMGKKLLAHASNAAKGLIPAKSWFGYPLQNTEINSVEFARSIQVFRLISYVCFVMSLAVAFGVLIWIVSVYFELY